MPISWYSGKLPGHVTYKNRFQGALSLSASHHILYLMYKNNPNVFTSLEWISMNGLIFRPIRETLIIDAVAIL